MRNEEKGRWEAEGSKERFTAESAKNTERFGADFSFQFEHEIKIIVRY
jgi:hypothetical protein